MRNRLVIACLALVALGGEGCYQRVVSSKGLGGMGTTIQDPYRSDTAADRAVDSAMGKDDSKPVRGATNMPVTRKTYWTDTSSPGSTVRP